MPTACSFPLNLHTALKCFIAEKLIVFAYVTRQKQAAAATSPTNMLLYCTQKRCVYCVHSTYWSDSTVRAGRTQQQ